MKNVSPPTNVAGGDTYFLLVNLAGMGSVRAEGEGDGVAGLCGDGQQAVCLGKRGSSGNGGGADFGAVDCCNAVTFGDGDAQLAAFFGAD